MGSRYKHRNIESFVKKLGYELNTEVKEAVIRGLRSTAAIGVTRVVQAIEDTKHGKLQPPVDTGEMRQSVGYHNLPMGAEIVVDSPHAPFMEYGTRPHFPPTKPLMLWAMRKGIAADEQEAKGVAFAIARKIAKDGTAPRNFFKRGWNKTIRRDLKREIEDELRRI